MNSLPTSEMSISEIISTPYPSARQPRAHLIEQAGTILLRQEAPGRGINNAWGDHIDAQRFELQRQSNREAFKARIQRCNDGSANGWTISRQAREEGDRAFAVDEVQSVLRGVYRHPELRVQHALNVAGVELGRRCEGQVCSGHNEMIIGANRDEDIDHILADTGVERLIARNASQLG